jgi:hypothetical protein
MTDVKHVEFDATLEEVADVNMRLLLNTKAYRRYLSQSQWAVGVVVAGVLAVMLEGHVSTALVVGLSAVCGVLSGYLSGSLYEGSVRRSYMRVVSELYGNVPTVPCTFELRENVLWSKMGSTECLFRGLTEWPLATRAIASRCGSTRVLQWFVTERFARTRTDLPFWRP